MKVKTAIVTTLADAGPVIETFIAYHHHIGFDHIYLFLDKPELDSVEKVKHNERVTIIENNDNLHNAWTKTRTYQVYKEYHHYIDTEVLLAKCSIWRLPVSLQ